MRPALHHQESYWLAFTLAATLLVRSVTLMTLVTLTLTSCGDASLTGDRSDTDGLSDIDADLAPDSEDAADTAVDVQPVDSGDLGTGDADTELDSGDDADDTEDDTSVDDVPVDTSDIGDDADDGVGDALDAVSDPGSPEFPETVGTFSVAVRTSDEDFAGTDDNALSICLTADRCWRLNVPDVNDFRLGELDVHHFEGINLPRSEVDRVEIRSSSGADRWIMGCLELRFDGEPVYCQDDLALRFGDDPGAGELELWQDPSGLHNACNTCYPEPLTHGPMVGAVDAETGRVWVRTDATRQVALRVSPTPNMTDAPVVAYAYPSPLDDFTATLAFEGMTADSNYYYRVEVDGVPMSSGPVAIRSAPEAGAAGQYTFAFGSCTRTDDQPIFASIQNQNPDLFFFAGDNHYANSPEIGALRWYYRWGLEVPERALLARNTPTLATWDDHDFVGNNTEGTVDPGRDSALRGFTEYWANPSYGTDETPGVFTIYEYGDLAFFLVDDRYYRDNDNEDMLGDAQTAWLLSALENSTATFKFLISGSAWHQQASSDSWTATAENFYEIADHLVAEEIEGVILMSGDVHRSEFREIDRTAAGGYDLPELVSSPLANTNSACPTNDTNIRYCNAAGNFFMTVSVDTTLADPIAIAELRNQSGMLLNSWALYASSLAFD